MQRLINVRTISRIVSASIARLHTVVGGQSRGCLDVPANLWAPRWRVARRSPRARWIARVRVGAVRCSKLHHLALGCAASSMQAAKHLVLRAVGRSPYSRGLGGWFSAALNVAAALSSDRSMRLPPRVDQRVRNTGHDFCRGVIERPHRLVGGAPIYAVYAIASRCLRTRCAWFCELSATA